MPSARAESLIAAPLEAVWQVMLDTDRYGEWNPFVVRIEHLADHPPREGDDLRLHVEWSDGGRVSTHERICTLEPPAQGRALLEYDFLGPLATLRLVRGRRRQELTAQPDGTTRYVTSERLHGLLAWAAPIGKVQDGFERHAQALKGRAEQV